MLVAFLGLPLRPSALGRAVRGLAARSALRFFATLKSLVWPSATPYHPSARFNRAALAIVCYEFLARPAIF